MPDALNHLASYNRIALALENMKQSDMAALVTAIEALVNKPVAPITVSPANPTITVSPANPTITVSPANPTITVSPAAPAITVSPANPTITVSPAITTGDGGSADCSCFAPLVQKIDELICVNAALTASAIQQAKAIAYWMQDGPGMGLDAPPGSFVFPDPGDTSPPQISTPPADEYTPIDSTGGWTTPPAFNGVVYVEPPGGMQGVINQSAYLNYKCDAAAFIYLNIQGFYSRILNLSIATTVVTAIASGPSVGVVASSLSLEASFVAAGLAIPLSFFIEIPIMIAIAAVMVTLLGTGLLLGTAFEKILALMEAHKEELLCALYKSKSIGEARDRFVAIVDANNDTASEYYMGQEANGNILILKYLLTDKLLSNLFSCHPDLDSATITGLGMAHGGCADCIFCKDMKVSLDVNLKSIFGYPAAEDEHRTGLVTYPLTYSVTFPKDVVAICLKVSSDNKTSGGGSNVPWFTANIFRPGNSSIVAANAIRCEVGNVMQDILIKAPTGEPFVGTYNVVLYCNVQSIGTRPTYTLHKLNYLEVEATP